MKDDDDDQYPETFDDSKILNINEYNLTQQHSEITASAEDLILLNLSNICDSKHVLSCSSRNIT